MGLSAYARRLQTLERLLPLRVRLPLRYRAQQVLRSLEPEIALLPSLLASRPGGVAVDVGANVGIYTYALARLGVRVHALEPQPSCCEVIQAWAAGSRLGGLVTVHNVAAGAEGGALTLHVPLEDGREVKTRASFEHPGQPCVETLVRVVALDALALQGVSFIKIDVEGHEWSVLQGARQLLARDRPVLLVEVDRSRHTRQAFMRIVELVRSLGYRCHVLDGDQLRPMSWEAPPEIYNFLFLPDHTGHPP